MEALESNFVNSDAFGQTKTGDSRLPLSIAELERKIAYQTGGRIRDLRLEEVGDSVVLYGRTSTYYIKQLASQIALNENRSLNFENTIEVI
jgi:hypothetical protein